MAEFLEGGGLATKIQEICKGPNVKCAVAFWGDGAKDFLFGDKVPSDLKIICDLSMGATNPKELEALGVPNSTNIRKLNGLHAKVYISDCGVVIASANASNNALDFKYTGSGHIEAGVFHGPKSKTYRLCSKWFEKLWKDGEGICEEDLKEAEKAWKRMRYSRNVAHPLRAATGKNVQLKDLVLDYPEALNDIHFVFTQGDIPPEKLKAVEVELKKAELVGDEISAMLAHAIESGELASEQWPERFINVHLKRNRKVDINLYRRGTLTIGGYHFPLAEKAPFAGFWEIGEYSAGIASLEKDFSERLKQDRNSNGKFAEKLLDEDWFSAEALGKILNES